jgi:hypothetical protein
MKNKIGYPELPKMGGPGGYTDKDVDMQWKVITAALTLEGRIYMPEALRNQVISHSYDNPENVHFGTFRTAEHVSRDVYWFGLHTMVRINVAGCEVCHPINAPRHP